MARIERVGGAQARRPTSKRVIAGRRNATRTAYDQRRRTTPLDDTGREYARILRLDPCAYCGGRCGQMAADHIDPLDAGGQNTWENLTAAGRPCNAAKKNTRLLMFLVSRPVGSRHSARAAQPRT